jgi:trimeric autotransporter adhesin
VPQQASGREIDLAYLAARQQAAANGEDLASIEAAYHTVGHKGRRSTYDLSVVLRRAASTAWSVYDAAVPCTLEMLGCKPAHESDASKAAAEANSAAIEAEQALQAFRFRSARAALTASMPTELEIRLGLHCCDDMLQSASSSCISTAQSSSSSSSTAQSSSSSSSNSSSSSSFSGADYAHTASTSTYLSTLSSGSKVIPYLDTLSLKRCAKTSATAAYLRTLARTTAATTVTAAARNELRHTDERGARSRVASETAATIHISDVAVAAATAALEPAVLPLSSSTDTSAAGATTITTATTTTIGDNTLNTVTAHALSAEECSSRSAVDSSISEAQAHSSSVQTVVSEGLPAGLVSTCTATLDAAAAALHSTVPLPLPLDSSSNSTAVVWAEAIAAATALTAAKELLRNSHSSAGAEVTAAVHSAAAAAAHAAADYTAAQAQWQTAVAHVAQLLPALSTARSSAAVERDALASTLVAAAVRAVATVESLPPTCAAEAAALSAAVSAAAAAAVAAKSEIARAEEAAADEQLRDMYSTVQGFRDAVTGWRALETLCGEVSLSTCTTHSSDCDCAINTCLILQSYTLYISLWRTVLLKYALLYW